MTHTPPIFSVSPNPVSLSALPTPAYPRACVAAPAVAGGGGAAPAFAGVYATLPQSPSFPKLDFNFFDPASNAFFEMWIKCAERGTQKQRFGSDRFGSTGLASSRRSTSA